MRKATFWLIAAIWFFSVIPCVAGAESPEAMGPAEPIPTLESQQLDLPSYRDPQSPLPGAGITSQIFTALGSVLGLMVLAFYLYRRIAMRGSRDIFRDGTVRILSRTYLGQKESLCLVQVGNDILLLGQTSTGITLLHTLPPQTSAAALSRRDAQATVGPPAHTGNRESSAFVQELVGLESRLKRLNRLWRTSTPGSDRGEVSE